MPDETREQELARLLQRVAELQAQEKPTAAASAIPTAKGDEATKTAHDAAEGPQTRTAIPTSGSYDGGSSARVVDVVVNGTHQDVVQCDALREDEVSTTTRNDGHEIIPTASATEGHDESTSTKFPVTDDTSASSKAVDFTTDNSQSVPGTTRRFGVHTNPTSWDRCLREAIQIDKIYEIHEQLHDAMKDDVICAQGIVSTTKFNRPRIFCDRKASKRNLYFEIMVKDDSQTKEFPLRVSLQRRNDFKANRMTDMYELLSQHTHDEPVLVFVCGKVTEDKVMKDAKAGALKVLVHTSEVNHRMIIRRLTIEQAYPLRGITGECIQFPLSEAGPLLGTPTKGQRPLFEHAWFVPDPEKIEKIADGDEDGNDDQNEFIRQLRQHIACYRNCGGGVIYLGMSRSESGEINIPDRGLKLDPRKLEDLQKLCDSALDSQEPPCRPLDHTPDTPVSALGDTTSKAWTTFFPAPGSGVGSDRFIVRIIVFRSEHELHVAKPSHVRLKHRGTEASKCISLAEFVKEFKDSVADTRSLIQSELSSPPQAEITENVASEWTLWRTVEPEGPRLDNKERSVADLIQSVVAGLVKYAPHWLNNKGGCLRFGVQNMPQEVTGVWLQDSSTKERLRKKIADRFKMNLETTNFCFPAASQCIKLEYHHVHATRDDLWHDESGDTVVVWLEARLQKSSSGTRYLADDSRRNVVREWTEAKENNDIHLFMKSADRPPLLLPLDPNLKGLLAPRCNGDATVFPCAVSKPRKWEADHSYQKSVPQLVSLLEALPKVRVQCVGLADGDLLHKDYCVLDVCVDRSKWSHRHRHLTQLPVLWTLGRLEQNESAHIGGFPTRIGFDQLLSRLETKVWERQQVKDVFRQDGVRPFLVTNVSASTANADSCVSALGRIPWAMVVYFDYTSKADDVNSFRTVAEKEKTYTYPIVDLPCEPHVRVAESKLDRPGNVYWLRALGPPDKRQFSPADWRLGHSTATELYSKCVAFATQVRPLQILVVWEHNEQAEKFAAAVATVCIGVLSASKDREGVRITVVSPISVHGSEFLKHLRRELDLAGKTANFVQLELHDLASVLFEHGPSDDPGDALTLLRRVPGGEARHKGSTLDYSTAINFMNNNVQYLHPGIERTFQRDDYDDGLSFLQGGIARWEDFHYENVVPRTEHTDKLVMKLRSVLRGLDHVETVDFYHEPGAGGSTIARAALWDVKLRHTFCCIVVSQVYPDFRKDVTDMINTKEGTAVLVLFDSSRSACELSDIQGRLSGLNVAILHVARFPSVPVPDYVLRESLSLKELEKFVGFLRKMKCINADSGALGQLYNYAFCDHVEIPLFIVMVTALQEKFQLMSEYVQTRLTDDDGNLLRHDTEAGEILLYMVFSRMMLGLSLPVEAARNYDSALPPRVRSMVLKEDQYLRLRHHTIDVEVVKHMLGHDPVAEPGEYDWGCWLTSFGLTFIQHLIETLPSVPLEDTIGRNIFERYFRRMVHGSRSLSEDTSKVATTLTEMHLLAGDEPLRKMLDDIMKILPDVPCRIQAHFHADIARVRMHLMRDTMASVNDEMQKAHELMTDDRTLYHQHGQLYFEHMLFLQGRITEPRETANGIIEDAQNASQLFNRSETCAVQGRTNRTYPIKSDVDCHIRCIEAICGLMKCTFNELPDELRNHSYIAFAKENVLAKLNILCTEDPKFERERRVKLLTLLGEDLKTELNRLRQILPLKGAHNLGKVAVAVKQTDELLRSMYGTAMAANQTESQKDEKDNTVLLLVHAIHEVITNPRKVGKSLLNVGHRERVHELDIYWRWFRFSPWRDRLDIMRTIVENYAPTTMKAKKKSGQQFGEKDTRLRSRSTNAKINFYYGVILLLQWNAQQNVEERVIVDCLRPKSENDVFGNRFREFLLADGQLLSSQDLDWWTMRALDEELNSLAEKGVAFLKFQGTVRSFESSVIKLANSGELTLTYRARSAKTLQWTPYATVEFFVSVSLEHGLQAHPIIPKQNRSRQRSGRFEWIYGERNIGRVLRIATVQDVKTVLFAPASEPDDVNFTPAECPLKTFHVAECDLEIGTLFSFLVIPYKLSRPWRMFASECCRENESATHSDA